MAIPLSARYWYSRRDMYFRLFVFYVQRLRAYWFPTLVTWLRAVTQLTVLVVFWRIAAANGEIGSVRQLVAYFLVASGVNELVLVMNLRYAGVVMNRIKDGTISQVLLRPVSAAGFLYGEAQGENLIATSLFLPAMFVGLALEPPSLFGLALFPFALLMALALSFAINLLIGCIAFVSVEASMLRWVLNFPIQLLSGALIPVALFSGPWADVLLRSPFPGMVAGPTLALQADRLTPELATILGSAALWAVALPILAIAVWNRSRRSYEAVGI